MKKITLIIIILLFSTANVFAEDMSSYKQKLEQCEKQQEIFVNKKENQSTAKMKQSMYDLNNCYEQVAYEIIDKYYTKNSREVKENLVNFLKSTYAITGDAYLSHDFCPGYCGSMHNLMYTSDTFHFLKKVIMLFINRLEGIN